MPGEVWASEETWLVGVFDGSAGYFLYCNRRVFPGGKGLLERIIERRAVADEFIHDGCRADCAIQTKGGCQYLGFDGCPGRSGRITDQDQFRILTGQHGLGIAGRDDERGRQFAVSDQLLQICSGAEDIFIQPNGLPSSPADHADPD